MRNHVVVVGYGTKGKAAVTTLIGDGAEVGHIVVVDTDRGRLDAASALGLVTVRGDATQSSVLRTAGLPHSTALIVATNRDDTAVLGVVRAGHIHQIDAPEVDGLERGDKLLCVRRVSPDERPFSERS